MLYHMSIETDAPVYIDGVSSMPLFYIDGKRRRRRERRSGCSVAVKL